MEMHYEDEPRAETANQQAVSELERAIADLNRVKEAREAEIPEPDERPVVFAVSVQTAARELQVTDRTIYRWIEQGRLTAEKSPHSDKLHIPRTAIEREKRKAAV